ncbi:MAG TPA: UDP-N-acetylmuramate dehydrogenase [Burkholderiales bacterium]|nr:UDP-N-acetylmuramate dehydrogenase [Burkholderiales bacterium]
MSLLTEHASLKAHNSFGLEAQARYLAVLRDPAELPAILGEAQVREQPLLVIGGGSNLLLTRDFPGLVLLVQNRGIELLGETDGVCRVRAAAGENWHGLVMHALQQGWYGLENLSLIPGTVGAAPIQNIGAYGVELESRFESLDAWEIDTGRIVTLDREACAFGYRDSLFKRAGRDRYIIVSVTLRLSREARVHVEYAELKAELAARGISAPTPRDVSDAVIALRTRKLPDPAVLGNAGSFFKNPVVDEEKLEALKVFYPKLVSYPQGNGLHKLAAGWMIDQAGWKGRALGAAAVYEKQALVLVNRGGATGADIAALARAIQADIRAHYAVELEPEPVWI